MSSYLPAPPWSLLVASAVVPLALAGVAYLHPRLGTGRGLLALPLLQAAVGLAGIVAVVRDVLLLEAGVPQRVLTTGPQEIAAIVAVAVLAPVLVLAVATTRRPRGARWTGWVQVGLALPAAALIVVLP